MRQIGGTTFYRFIKNSADKRKDNFYMETITALFTAKSVQLYEEILYGFPTLGRGAGIQNLIRYINFELIFSCGRSIFMSSPVENITGVSSYSGIHQYIIRTLADI